MSYSIRTKVTTKTNKRKTTSSWVMYNVYKTKNEAYKAIVALVKSDKHGQIRALFHGNKKVTDGLSNDC